MLVSAFFVAFFDPLVAVPAPSPDPPVFELEPPSSVPVESDDALSPPRFELDAAAWRSFFAHPEPR